MHASNTIALLKKWPHYLFNVLNAVATGLKPSCHQLSFREDCLAYFHPMWKKQEEVYSAVVLKAKAGKQKIVLLLLKGSSKSPVQIMQQFIDEISHIS